MLAYVDTGELHNEEGVDTDFTTKEALVGPYKGYAISYVVTNATADLSLDVKIQGSACSNGNYGVITGTKLHLAGDTTIVYNISNVYYKYIRVICDFTSGSCDLLMEITRKN